MHLLYQSTGFNFSDINLAKIIPLAREMGHETTDFGIIYTTGEITNLDHLADSEEPFLIFSSTGALKALSQPPKDTRYQTCFPSLSESQAQKLFFKIKENLFYDETQFDQAQIIETPMREHLLNGAGTIHTLSNVADTVFENVFIKPSKDLKYFTGGVIQKGTIREFIEKERSDPKIWKIDPTVLIAPLYEIDFEYRFFVIGGKISTCSQYKHEDKVISSPIVPAAAVRYAEKMIDLYQPAACFVIDVALMKDKSHKIVEYNCFNCSGLYSADMKQYLKDMEAFLATPLPLNRLLIHRPKLRTL